MTVVRLTKSAGEFSLLPALHPIANPRPHPEFFFTLVALVLHSQVSLARASCHPRCSTSTTIAAPLDWVEAVGKLHLPSTADSRLQKLMDRNNEDLLGQSELEELAALVELSEKLRLVRGEAWQILGKRP